MPDQDADTTAHDTAEQPARDDTPITIRPATTADDEARDAFVRGAERGTFFHLSGWRRTVERVMRHRGCDLLALRGDEVVGVLPLMECRGLRGGRSLISIPYAVYGGAAGTSREVEHALFAEAERLAVAQNVGRLELRCLDDPELDLPGSELYATFIRELPEKPEDVLAKMPKKARAEARKARKKHDLELSEGDWYVEDLIRLFHRNKRSLGSPALPAAMFKTLMEEFPGEFVVHLVRRGSEPLAAVMSFLFRDQVLAYYSGTGEGVDRAFSASNFMYLSLQEWCIEHGYRIFDFGRSRKDSGAHSFKTHQGFEPRDLHYRYRLVKDDAPPSLNPSNPKTKVLQDTWRRLPLWMTSRLSTRASRYLP
ncbi:MAG: FemAB family PEP-CTERM system-associated protein [bacterium]|nr:FemAB family PEP-CTERM system-associated protein [bacterium]